jgi:hypothetical protein
MVTLPLLLNGAAKRAAIDLHLAGRWRTPTMSKTKLMLLVLDMRDVLVERTLRCADQVMHLGWDDLELVVGGLW